MPDPDMKGFSHITLVTVHHQRKPTFLNIFERSKRFEMVHLQMNEIFHQNVSIKVMKSNTVFPLISTSSSKQLGIPFIIKYDFIKSGFISAMLSKTLVANIRNCF